MRTFKCKILLSAVVCLVLSACAHDGTYLTVNTDKTSVVRAVDQAVLADAIDTAFSKIDTQKMKEEFDDQKKADSSESKESPAQSFVLKLDDEVRSDLEKLGNTVGNKIAGRLMRKLRDLEDGDDVAAALKEEIQTHLKELARDIETIAEADLKKKIEELEETISSAEASSQGGGDNLDSMTAYVEVVSVFDLPEPTIEYLKDKAGVIAAAMGIRVLEVRTIYERPNPERTLEIIQIDYPDTHARVVLTVSYAGVDEENTTIWQETHGSANADSILHGRFKATFAVVPRTAAFSGIMQSIDGESTYSIVKGEYVDKR